MRDKLEKIIKAYEELEKKLSDPAVASDIKEFTRLNKEYAHQSDLIAASREYIGALDDIEAAKEMLHDTTDADEKEMPPAMEAFLFLGQKLSWPLQIYDKKGSRPPNHASNDALRT